MRKPTLFFIYHLIWDINSQDISQKYQMFSRNYNGIMTYLSKGYGEKRYGDFACKSFPYSNPLKRLLLYPFFCLRNAKSLSSIDAIITYDCLLGGLIGLLLKWITKSPLIVEVNGFNLADMQFEANSAFSKLKILIAPIIMKFVLSNADAVKFVSEELGNDVEKYFNSSFRKKACFFDFVPTDIFTPRPPSDPPYIFTAGYPFNRKGVDILIQAFNQITTEHPELTLKIIGFCEDLTPYKELAGDNKRIEFHKPLKYDEIVPVFENSLFFVLASRSEGMGRVLIEAMASGKPLIGSKVGGIPSLVKDGINGFLFDSENIEMLADRMRSLLNDRNLLNVMGHESLNMAREKYSTAKYVEYYSDLIEQVLSPEQ